MPPPHSEDNGFMGYEPFHTVDEAVGIISGIVISQEIEKSGKSFDYYDAVGPKAREIIAEKGVEISDTGYFSYETFRAQGHFVVVAKALPKSGLNGKIIYESKTEKWVGTEDILQEWLP
jgi:hypothetical protein